MTKRFTFTQDTLAKADVFDENEFVCCTLSIWVEQLVDLLNQLNDKCEFLEIENESLEDGATKYAELYHKSLKENEQLKKENQELRQDNDIKFWKLQCIQSSNNNQIMLFELSRAIQQGYEFSDKFKQYLNEIKEHDKEIREKHKRLFE